MSIKRSVADDVQLMANDLVESRFPTTGGLLFEWLDRKSASRLLTRADVSQDSSTS